MADEEKQGNKRLTKAKFAKVLEALGEKISKEDLDKILASSDLDRSMTMSRSVMGVGNLGPYYATQETYDQFDEIIAYYIFTEEGISKNEIFRRAIERFHKSLMKRVENDKAMKKIKQLAEDLATERAEKKAAKKSKKFGSKEEDQKEGPKKERGSRKSKRQK